MACSISALTGGAPFDLSVREATVWQLIRFGAEVKTSVNTAYPAMHTDILEINLIYGTIIANAPRNPSSTQAICIVFANREVDRSPSGSGTPGRVAQLYLRGKLAFRETLVNQSIVGTTFSGCVIRETAVGDFPAVINEIEGSAHI